MVNIHESCRHISYVNGSTTRLFEEKSISAGNAANTIPPFFKKSLLLPTGLPISKQ